MQQPICLFDSGIGGLTVLKKLATNFPFENYIYLADLARVPFGDRSREDINNIVNEMFDWLMKFNPKMVIMACNTSSAVFDFKSQEFKSKINIPVYGMVESCAKEIAQSKYKKVSVWATKLAANSNIYKKTIQNINPHIGTEEIACPKLVPMIEDLSFNFSDREEIIKEYLNMTSQDSEALILGCTHYPHITNTLLKHTKMDIIDPADSLIKELESSLKKINNPELKRNISLYTTAQTEKLEKFSRLYLCEIYKTSLINLSKVFA
jgi:glutamate racemase